MYIIFKHINSLIFLEFESFFLDFPETKIE